MIRRVLHALRPHAREVRGLALRETDPARYREFEPIVWGPAGNAGLLLLVAAAAVLTLPVRLVARVLRKQ